MDHYHVLGVLKNATQSEIEAAFERLKEQNVGGAAKQIHKAYFWLHDPERRKEYDRLGESQLLEPEPGGIISDEEFRSWLEPGKTITEGVIAKLRGERDDIERQRDAKQAWKSNSEPVGIFLASALGIVATIAVIMLMVWVLLSGVRWFWNHPLW